MTLDWGTDWGKSIHLMQETAKSRLICSGALFKSRAEFKGSIRPVPFTLEFATEPIVSISRFSFVCPSLLLRECTLLAEKNEMFELGPKRNQNR